MDHNPFVTGIHIDKINKYIKDNQYKVIDLSDALSQQNNKYQAICKSLGVIADHIKKPSIYLTHLERLRISEFRNCYNGLKIGVIAGSRSSYKNWGYTDFLVSYLANKNYNIFVFDPYDSKDYGIKNVNYVNDKMLRDFIVKIGAMDIIVSPDTGSAHIAGALDIPSIVICPEQFIDLYEKYNNIKIIKGTPFNLNNYKLPNSANDNILIGAGKSAYNAIVDTLTRRTPNGILNVSVNQVLQEVNLKVATLTPPKASPENAIFIRIRGIGDVILSLPSIRTYKELYPNCKITYVTSNTIKPLLDNCPYIDNIIGTNYQHQTSGYPPPPPDIDYNNYDEIYNMINRVDFEPDSYNTSRVSIFGNLINIKDIDYKLDWRFDIPNEWLDAVKDKISRYNIDYNKLVSVQVDAQGLSRRWQLDRQSEVIKKLTDRGYCVAILSDMRYETANPKVINLTKELSFNEYLAMIKLSRLVIGSDSSAMHIAGLLNTQALGLYGSVDPELRVSHYQSVTFIKSQRYCSPCNDWLKRSCCNDKNCPTCLYEINPRLIYAKAIKLLEKE